MQRKIELKKSSPLLKIKNTQPQNPTLQRQMKRNDDNRLQTRWKEGQLITAPTKNYRFSASVDSFVVQQIFVLRMNICGKNCVRAANR